MRYLKEYSSFSSYVVEDIKDMLTELSDKGLEVECSEYQEISSKIDIIEICIYKLPTNSLIFWSEIKDVIIRITEYSYENNMCVSFYIDKIKCLENFKSRSDFKDVSSGLTTFSFSLNIQKSKKRVNESRKENLLDICYHDAKIDQVLDEHIIYQYIEGMHRNKEDFIDGDIVERIEKYKSYKLKEIPIDKIRLEDFDLDIDKMKEYKEETKSSGEYPPIVLESEYYGQYIIIDGTHRSNALKRLGYKTIKSWVGIK